MTKKKTINQIAKELNISNDEIRDMRISELYKMGYKLVLDLKEKEYKKMIKFIKNPKSPSSRLKNAMKKTESKK